ncbi:hypothetical protein I317_04297 [Kwoniella heveanensis CBS 569]|uniref:Diphthamide biosynthesis protein 3 n=1 Tax=Kwoniella heveanensis BCC8398 TaxID=1296120 RepID=A0A1B9GPP4_9TREE|nr:hypothetical protein I316_05325 [Kwoniella heveanensis BCC8398]OCF41887.1 hypothetical protein I317_04297 [Kwoniella heveanensis CBS 569]
MPNYYDELEIEDFVWDPVAKVFHYPCPCGDRFEISKGQLRDGEEIAICPSCSLIVRVIYDYLDWEDYVTSDEEDEVDEVDTPETEQEEANGQDEEVKKGGEAVTAQQGCEDGQDKLEDGGQVEMDKVKEEEPKDKDKGKERGESHNEGPIGAMGLRDGAKGAQQLGSRGAADLSQDVQKLSL